jgi:cysteinyl-tRNA synthetase
VAVMLQPIAVTPFRLHDSMRREKVPFEPLVPAKIGMYLCGPTTYAPAHIGHAFSAIAFDTIRRSLGFLGWDVKYVRNVTDVDDKIIKAANESGQDPLALSAKYAADYNRDMAMFNVLPPDVEPRVSGHITQIVTLIERLVANGHAYPVDGDVYYEVDKFPPYGRLSGKKLDDLRAGARVDVDERKKSPADFALWKAAKPGEPSWDSPWGKGRPGWHIECSAMTVTHLGVTFDIHAGGDDLIFPHHENEIAQSQGADGEGTFARYWLHNGRLRFGGEKMSKSLGNVFGCEQIAEAVGGEALRFFCVSYHYRSSVDFEVQILDGAPRFYSLEAADRDLSYFYKTLLDVGRELGADPVPEGERDPSHLTAVRDALADDFNTPVAVAKLHEIAKQANKLLVQKKGVDKQVRLRTLAHLADDLRKIGSALGILAQPPAAYLADRRARLVRLKKIDVAVVEAKVAERSAARAAKDWTRSDAIKAELNAMGVQLHDTPGGTDWSVQD